MNSKPQDHSELVQKILSGTRWATMLRIAAQVFSWLSTIIVVRFISPEDYGLNAMLESPLVLLMLLSTLGLDAALVQTKNIEHDALRSVFGWLLILNGIIFLTFFFGATLLASYFHEPRLDPLAKALACIFLLVPFRVIPNALLDRALDFKLKAQLELVATVVTAIVTLAMAYMGAGVWALVTGVLVNRLLLAVLLMIFKPWFIVPKFEFTTPGKMMAFGGLITLAGACTLLSDMVATLLAGPALGPEALGIYAIAGQFAQLPLAKGMPIINQTMLPAFSRFQADRAAATYYLERLLGVAALVFVPLMVGMACVSNAFVMSVLGEKWIASILPLALMSVGMIFRMNAFLHKSVITSMGGANLTLMLSFLQLVLLFLMTYMAIEYGVVGLVLAWVATEFIVMLATVQTSKLVLNTSFLRFIKVLRPALVSSAVMAACVIGAQYAMKGQSNLLALFAQIIVGAIAYFLVIRLFFSNELQVVLKAFFGDRFA